MANQSYQYHDILLLGKTGKGKSSVGNKLLGLNGDGSSRSDSANVCCPKVCDVKRSCSPAPSNSQDGSNSHTNISGVSEAQQAEMFSSDRTATSLVSGELGDEQFAYFKTGEGEESVTLRPRVLVNETTAIRVCDTQGFAQSGRTVPAIQANLELIRQVLLHQEELKLQFSRVLYFLPSAGAPERADGVLRDEIAILHHYFGKSIWERTKVVVTAPPRYEKQKYIEICGDPVEAAKKPLTEALQVVARQYKEEVERPEIIFLSCDDDCEKVKEAVDLEKASGVLSVRQDVCLKCSALVTFDTDYKDSDHDDSIAVPLAVVREGILISHDVCHPKFKNVRKWMFWTDERCVCCGTKPGGKQGCCRIKSNYEKILVEHKTAQSLEKLKLHVAD